MNVYKEIAREFYVYGTTMRRGCGKTHDRFHGAMRVITAACGCKVIDTFKVANDAIKFMNEIASHYPISQGYQVEQQRLKIHIYRMGKLVVSMKAVGDMNATRTI